MKIRLLSTLVLLAISFALPTFAQEQNAVTPRVRDGIEDVLNKYEEAYNRHDAAAVAGLYTEDGVEARLFPTNEGGGTFSGRQALEKRFEADFARNDLAKITCKMVIAYMVGEGVCVLMDMTFGTSVGYVARIYVPDDSSADLWKIRISFESF